VDNCLFFFINSYLILLLDTWAYPLCLYEPKEYQHWCSSSANPKKLMTLKLLSIIESWSAAATQNIKQPYNLGSTASNLNWFHLNATSLLAFIHILSITMQTTISELLNIRIKRWVAYLNIHGLISSISQLRLMHRNNIFHSHTLSQTHF